VGQESLLLTDREIADARNSVKDDLTDFCAKSRAIAQKQLDKGLPLILKEVESFFEINHDFKQLGLKYDSNTAYLKWEQFIRKYFKE